MLHKVLIANRGEIACRIIETCRRLGAATVAVYSEADRDARHVRMADEAVCIGPAPAGESYLDAEAILRVARDTGAEAVHPGYGFLSENAGFARACDKAGIIFIGPAPETIEAMGSKSESKRLMEAAGVPTVPGWHGGKATPAQLRKHAQKIGFPLMIKAVAGGGGKGMRVVREAGEFDEALAGAQREARNAFGEDQVLLERYLEHPRHIEMQIFGDRHGSLVHLFERECSIQRRYQKIIEESPSPFVDDIRRGQMGEAAIRAARAVHYVGAGTVEFIVDASGEFFFMEMNTRLQVEHPVTEMVTGLDLVEWQLLVAAGEPLPLSQEAVECHGHAMEARIYAENPAQGFLPATGHINHIAWPPATEQVRIDTGIQVNDRVGVHYDPMLAKLIVHAEDRPRAVTGLRRALALTAISGVGTNIDFLSAVAGLDAFAEGRIDTGFVDAHIEELTRAPQAPPPLAWLAGAAALLLEQDTLAADQARAGGDPYSPWHRRDAWRLNGASAQHLVLNLPGEAPVDIEARPSGRGWQLELDGQHYGLTEMTLQDGHVRMRVDGHRHDIPVLRQDTELLVTLDRVRHALHITRAVSDQAEDESGLLAPMPGRVVQVHVREGEQVAADAPLLVLEAMKMEYTVRAPASGTVDQVLFAEGDTVEADTPLVEFTPDTP